MKIRNRRKKISEKKTKPTLKQELGLEKLYFTKILAGWIFFLGVLIGIINNLNSFTPLDWITFVILVGFVAYLWFWNVSPSYKRIRELILKIKE